MKRAICGTRSIRILQLFLLLILSLSTAQERRIQQWPVPESIRPYISEMVFNIDPTLHAPMLKPEPEYTGGLENTIYWYGDSVRSWMDQSNMDLLFFEVQAIYDGKELWGYVDADVDSAVFTNLPDAVSIQYRLRYFAKDETGSYRMSYWSQPEISIQDITPPVVWPDESGILEVEESGGKRWVLNPLLRIKITASDSLNGKVMEIALRESSSVVDHTVHDSNFIPETVIEDTLLFPLKSREEIPVVISWWVTDMALQKSEVLSDTIFWWPAVDEGPRLISFPNPFNPYRESASIQVSVPGVTEAKIFDPFGNLVRVLHKEEFDRTFEWDGKNDRGEIVSSGGYICVLKNRPEVYCKIAVFK